MKVDHILIADIINQIPILKFKDQYKNIIETHKDLLMVFIHHD